MQDFSLSPHATDDDKLHEECGVFGIFGTDNARKWHQALKSLGIDPLALSTAAGHA